MGEAKGGFNSADPLIGLNWPPWHFLAVFVFAGFLNRQIGRPNTHAQKQFQSKNGGKDPAYSNF